VQQLSSLLTYGNKLLISYVSALRACPTATAEEAVKPLLMRRDIICEQIIKTKYKGPTPCPKVLILSERSRPVQ